MYPIISRDDLIVDTKAIHYFTKEWAAQGHDVFVIHNYIHPFKNIFKNRNIINSFKSTHINTNSLDSVDVLLIENQFIFPKQRTLKKWQINRISKIINKFLDDKKYDPDVIVCHFPTYFPNMMDNFSNNIHRIAVLHNTDITTINRLGSKFLVKSVFNKYDSTFHRSLRIKNDFRKYISGNKDGLIVSSGYPDYLIPEEVLPHTFRNPFKILFVGKLIKLKNVDMVLNALKRIENYIDFEFTIIGEGPEHDYIIRLINKLELVDKVQILGFLSRKEVMSHMLTSDIFVMISKPETLGLVYLEAMGCGCVTIGTKNEGIDGIINHGSNGFLVDIDSEYELENVLLQISKLDRIDLNSISNNSMETAKRYTEFKAAMDYLNNIVQVMSEDSV